MNYIYGTLSIFKDRFLNLNLFKNMSVPRIYPHLPVLEQYRHFYAPPTQIIPGLYLGSSFNSYNIDEYKENKIKTIINITEEIPNYYESKIRYYKYAIKDDGNDDITDILIETSHIINNSLSSGKNVFVHCYMGASRSASVIVYYLVKHHNMSLTNAINFVKSKRDVVNISYKFYNELLEIV
jgi:atypical dual specificity phosphatase